MIGYIKQSNQLKKKEIYLHNDNKEHSILFWSNYISQIKYFWNTLGKYLPANVTIKKKLKRIEYLATSCGNFMKGHLISAVSF